jgi:hypothetical protein
MLEPGIEQQALPPSQTQVAQGIDGRGWVVVVLAMLVIGGLSLRSVPTPGEPARIAAHDSQDWMADALPGIGPKSRDLMASHIRAGAFDSLPARSQVIAKLVFTWPTTGTRPKHMTPRQAP